MPGKSGKSSVKGKGKKAVVKKPRKKANTGTYKQAIYKVLKQVSPTMSVSKKSMSILNSFTLDVLGALCNEARSLTAHSKGVTCGSREVGTATKVLLPGELAQHAVAEGGKAVARWGH